MKNNATITGDIQRLSIVIRGAVQGVGFRPFIYRLAHDHSLAGWVLNSTEGVFIEAEGPKDSLESFLLRIQKEKPPRSFIQSFESAYLDPAGYSGFEIRKSSENGTISAIVLPDIATCPECLSEIFNPFDRRFLYPFTNCTNCGPRYSIIDSLPYDRPNTAMSGFTMCPQCREEYESPSDRRFHAQPNACPACGPVVELWNGGGTFLLSQTDAIRKTCELLRNGAIAAVKGIGGFHLVTDARNEAAITSLRSRKHREEKPFALMFPDIHRIADECDVSHAEERLLLSPEAPIVLLKKKSHRNGASCIASVVAPNNPNLGIMLPSNPLHHILMHELGFPVVATSGNATDEPICTDNHEAVRRLSGIADVFLVHNRPIRRHLDDSIVRVVAGREMVLRRARGFAPLPVQIRRNTNNSLLATGAHLKNTIALTSGNNVVVSQHIGDLENEQAYNSFREVFTSLTSLYGTKPDRIACDLHPDYLSTQFARSVKLPLTQVQHHHAHVASCMAENRLEGKILGIAWDGTGYGTDGTIWGGESFITEDESLKRIGTFRQFRLPGGEKAVKEPRRAALGLLYEIFGQSLFGRNDIIPVRALTSGEQQTFQVMLARGINAPYTSSAGRLFDAVASLIGLRHRVSFEGQAAMELEYLAGSHQSAEPYPILITNREGDPGCDQNPLFVFDWEPMIRAVLDELTRCTDRRIISARFHATLAECILQVAKAAGEERVVLSGGCFQNVVLTELTIRKLREEGFRPYWHQRIPPNDGGIALGQIAVALRPSLPSCVNKKDETHVSGNPG